MLKERIKKKSAEKLKLVPYTVKSWAEEVHVKPLSAGELSDLLDEAQRDAHTADMRMVSLSVRDESGVPLFDLQEVRELEPIGCGELIRECTRINSLHKDSRDEKKSESDPTPT